MALEILRYKVKDNFYIELSNKVQVTPLGREIICIGSSIDFEQERWVNGEKLHYHTHTFRFLDTKGGYISFTFNYFDKLFRIDIN